jgi:hypothetical protein
MTGLGGKAFVSSHAVQQAKATPHTAVSLTGKAAPRKSDLPTSAFESISSRQAFQQHHDIPGLRIHHCPAAPATSRKH